MFKKLSIIKTSRVLKKFFKSEIYPEGYLAYANRLPKEIQVNWFRDGGMIIGKVTAGGKEFVTQGVDADDFICMINESVFTVFNIPHDYFDVMRQTRTFKPPQREMELLEDRSVSAQSFGSKRNDLLLQPA